MKYEIAKASNVAKRAIRRVNKQQIDQARLMRQKKYAMKQYRKMINTKKKASEARLNQDYSKYIEWAIITTIALAVLSISHPQIGILAIIFSILIVAAIIDTKVKASNALHKQEQNRKDQKLEKLIRFVQNEKHPAAIEVKSVSLLEKTLNNLKVTSPQNTDETKSFTEFPYRNIQ